MAALLILLTAVDEGLGGLFFGVPPAHHDAVKVAFGIPSGRAIVGVVSIGYALPGRRAPACGAPGGVSRTSPTGVDSVSTPVGDVLDTPAGGAAG